MILEVAGSEMARHRWIYLRVEVCFQDCFRVPIHVPVIKAVPRWSGSAFLTPARKGRAHRVYTM